MSTLEECAHAAKRFRKRVPQMPSHKSGEGFEV